MWTLLGKLVLNYGSFQTQQQFSKFVCTGNISSPKAAVLTLDPGPADDLGQSGPV